MSSTHWYGALTEACERCGRRHRTNSPTRRFCAIWAEHEGPRGIAAAAAVDREDGERHFAKYLATGSETRLRMAREAYAKAFEKEN